MFLSVNGTSNFSPNVITTNILNTYQFVYILIISFVYFFQQISKKPCAAFKLLQINYTHIITTIMHYSNSFELIVIMMIIFMVSFSDQLNCFCEICYQELDIDGHLHQQQINLIKIYSRILFYIINIMIYQNWNCNYFFISSSFYLLIASMNSRNILVQLCIYVLSRQL